MATPGFLSTPSARRATFSRTGRASSIPDFYPRPPRGGRPTWGGGNGRREYFYPRPPRGGRPVVAVVEHHDLHISIHALREEGDAGSIFRCLQHGYFYPRPPRGGRPNTTGAKAAWTLFLSTPSARRATSLLSIAQCGGADFYPRPPRGGRRLRHFIRYLIFTISIHALREEGDTSASWITFLPNAISIHALREEGDLVRPLQHQIPVNFYPRPPRGGRPRDR